MSADPRRTRGLLPAAASLMGAGAVAATIVGASEHTRLALPLVAFGLLMLTVAVATRSDRLVALASVPILAAAVVHVQLSDASVALWALGIGCGWYVATELAWESISRRVECRFGPGTARQRAQEIVTVVAITCLIATTALAASNLAPRRTVLLEAVVIVTVIGGAATAIRRLTTS